MRITAKIQIFKCKTHWQVSWEFLNEKDQPTRNKPVEICRENLKIDLISYMPKAIR